MVSEEFMDEIIESEIEQMDENCEKRISGAQEIISSQCDKIEQLKAELIDSKQQVSEYEGLYEESKRMRSEITALKSKLKIAVEALDNFFIKTDNPMGQMNEALCHARKALSEIGGEI